MAQIRVISNVDKVAADFERAAAGLPTAIYGMSVAVGQEIRDSWLAVAASHGMAPGGRIAGGLWGVSAYTSNSNLHPTTIVQFWGPVHLVLAPTAPHMIYPRGNSRSSRFRENGKKAVAFNGGVYASAYHPGTRGKIGIVPEAEAIARRLVKMNFEAAVTEHLDKSFRFE